MAFAQTCENWRYWVFTAIVGHFVHSFAHEVNSHCFADLESTSLEWITNSMTLQQLRKGQFMAMANSSLFMLNCMFQTCLLLALLVPCCVA